MVTVFDFSVKNKLRRFVVVFTVSGVNYVIAFPKVLISSDCIVYFELSGSIMLLVNGFSVGSN